VTRFAAMIRYFLMRAIYSGRCAPKPSNRGTAMQMLKGWEMQYRRNFSSRSFADSSNRRHGEPIVVKWKSPSLNNRLKGFRDGRGVTPVFLCYEEATAAGLRR